MDRQHSMIRIRCRSLALCMACFGLIAPAIVFAAPPRVIDEDDERLQPAKFADLEEPDAVRSLPPRPASEPRSRAMKATASKSWQSTSLWGTVLGLFVVLGLCLSARAWLTRYGPAAFRGLPVEALELLGKRTIEPRVTIHLVRCGPKILLLGVSPDGVRTLSEITDPVEIDLLAGACRRKEVDPTVSFATKYRQTDSAIPRSPLREA